MHRSKPDAFKAIVGWALAHASEIIPPPVARPLRRDWQTGCSPRDARPAGAGVDGAGGGTYHSLRTLAVFPTLPRQVAQGGENCQASYPELLIILGRALWLGLGIAIVPGQPALAHIDAYVDPTNQRIVMKNNGRDYAKGKHDARAYNDADPAHCVEG